MGGRYLNQVDVSIIDENDSIIDRSYYEAKIRHLKKRIERYQDKDPTIPINDLYADSPNILTNIRSSKETIKEMKGVLSLKTNSISFQNVAMEPKIKDDPEMLEFVNQTLEQCNDLMVRK